MNSKDSEKSSQKRKKFINSRKVHEIKKKEKRHKKANKLESSTKK